MAERTQKDTQKDQDRVHNDDRNKPRFSRAYSFALVTGALFLLSVDRPVLRPDGRGAQRGQPARAGVRVG